MWEKTFFVILSLLTLYKQSVFFPQVEAAWDHTPPPLVYPHLLVLLNKWCGATLVTQSVGVKPFVAQHIPRPIYAIILKVSISYFCLFRNIPHKSQFIVTDSKHSNKLIWVLDYGLIRLWYVSFFIVLAARRHVWLWIANVCFTSQII